MATPNPVGLIHFDEPRAVQVREPENLKSVHSAIHCGVNVYTETRLETEFLLQRWPELMLMFDTAVKQILADMPEPEAQVT